MKKAFIVQLIVIGLSSATDISTLPFNTWTSIPIAMDMRGHDGAWGWVAGYSSATYDKDRGQMLLADGYADARRVISIYTDCIYSYDPDSNTMIYRKAHNWTVVQHTSSYTTDPLPENAADSTPPPHHIYNGFLYVHEKNALYMMQGANQTLSAENEVHLRNLWIYPFDTGKWREVAVPFANMYEGHLRYVPGGGKLFWFSSGGCSSTTNFWEFDLEAETWTLKHSPPICVYGSESMTDPQRERIVIWSGGFGFFSTYFHAYVPSANRLDTITPSNTGPTPRYYGQILYINKYDVYMMVNGCVEPGDWNFANDAYVYDPRTNLWESCPAPIGASENIIYDGKREAVMYYTRHPLNYTGVQVVHALRYKRAGAPEAAFTASGNASLAVNLDASASTDSGGSITLYEWDFGYGWEAFTPQDSGITASHAFPREGAYTVALRVTDNDGRSTIATKEVVAGNTALPGGKHEKTGALSVYPNPARSAAVISVTGEKTVRVFNVKGELMGSLTSVNDRAILDATKLAPGIYFIRAGHGRNTIQKTVCVYR